MVLKKRNFQVCEVKRKTLRKEEQKFKLLCHILFTNTRVICMTIITNKVFILVSKQKLQKCDENKSIKLSN